MIRRVGVLAALLALAALAGVHSSAHAGTTDLTRRVDPFIGTGGHGHTYPGPSLPFGMIQPGPDTRLTGWDGCSGYHYSDSTVFGFSHTHLSGTGVADYCDILFLPATGQLKLRNNYENTARDGYGSRFRKSTERAEPGYYRVTLDDYRVDVELTATLRTAWHRYTFRNADNAHVLIDLTHRDEVLDSYIRVIDSRHIEGLRRSKSWAKDQRVYFAAEFDRDFEAELFVDDASATGVDARGKNVKAVFRFDVKKGARVQAKVAISSVNETGAWRSLRAEAPGWDFDATRKAARRAWNEELHKIEVEGGTDEQQTIFYTALYHTLLQPNTFEDVDGRFRGMDGEVHDSPGYRRYSVFSLWDTFRAAHPLYTIIERDRTLDFIKTFLAMYQESGRLPVWELWGNETDCMIGYHAVSVITDAFVKGICDFDTSLALEAMIATADADRFGLDSYKKYGYIPADKESESVSKTLEYAYDDWCIQQLAVWVHGHSADWERFRRRSHSWQNLWSPEGFFRPRANGRWVTPFDPREVTFHYTEANAWQYRFFVPHDIEALASPWFEPKGMAAALDDLFSSESHTTGREQADITGMIGQYAHGNEPSHHIAYLYAWARVPAKGQAMVRRIMSEMYHAAPDGLIGNEDCGQMSAWYVFSALGFYPVTPGSRNYIVGSPLFDRASVHLENGNTFMISASHGGVDAPYVQSAQLNGHPFDGPLMSDAIQRGGDIHFEMGRSAGTCCTPFQGDVIFATTIPHAMVAEGAPVFTDSVVVRLDADGPGDGIFYTIDGSEPDSSSFRYSEPFFLTRSAMVRFRRAEPNNVWSPIVDASFRKIDPRVKLTMRNPVHRQYKAGGDLALIDGIRGGNDFRLGAWQGYYGVDLDADLDLGDARVIHRIATGFLHDQNSWIFFPLEVVYSVSMDGKAWEEVGRAKSQVDPHHDRVVTEDFAVELAAPKRARFVRVLGRSPIMCPDWHKGAGNQAFIFADEIVVE